MPFLRIVGVSKKHKEVFMPLFRVAVKQSRNSNRVRLEKECQLLIAIDCSFVLSIPETKIYD